MLQFSQILPPPLPYLGQKHESLPNHQRRKDNHCQIQDLKEQLTFVRPELFQLQDLLIYHILNHDCLFAFSDSFSIQFGKFIVQGLPRG